MADDEDHIRQLIRLYLANDGFTVLEAKTGKEALDSWQKDNPDMVILDIMMPEMDGWEVLKQIRRQKNTPVIMLTAKDAEVDKVLGLELGAEIVLTHHRRVGGEKRAEVVHVGQAVARLGIQLLFQRGQPLALVAELVGVLERAGGLLLLLQDGQLSPQPAGIAFGIAVCGQQRQHLRILPFGTRPGRIDWPTRDKPSTDRPGLSTKLGDWLPRGLRVDMIPCYRAEPAPIIYTRLH